MQVIDLIAVREFAVKNEVWFKGLEGRSPDQWLVDVGENLKRHAPDETEIPFNPFDIGFVLNTLISVSRRLQSLARSYGSGSLTEDLQEGLNTLTAVLPSTEPTRASAMIVEAMFRMRVATQLPNFKASLEGAPDFYELMFAGMILAWLLTQPGAYMRDKPYEWLVEL